MHNVIHYIIYCVSAIRYGVILKIIRQKVCALLFKRYIASSYYTMPFIVVTNNLLAVTQETVLKQDCRSFYCLYIRKTQS
jgi:hypothetical protein